MTHRRVVRWGLAAGIALGLMWAPGVAAADVESPSGTAKSDTAGPHRPAAGARAGARSATPAKPAATARPRSAATGSRAGATRTPVEPAESSTPATTVTVRLPPMPVRQGASFVVSPEAVTEAATDYVAGGGDPADSPRFFFGDLAVRSLGALAAADPMPDRVRTDLGNLAVSGYFGGVWLRDNLRDTPVAAPPSGAAIAVAGAETASAAKGIDVSAIGLRIFDALTAGLTGLAATRQPRVVTTAARATVPVLLTLYGYNRGYLQFLLENPPAGVPSVQDTLSCRGFLDCNSSAFPLEIATRYDSALARLAGPTSPAWREMSTWTSLLEGATGVGRGVWGLIAEAGAFSPASYGALVDLSSAYLMVTKAAVLASMLAYADGDVELGRSALRLQAGLWMWSGAYFAGLASDAPRGTVPSIV